MSLEKKEATSEKLNEVLKVLGLNSQDIDAYFKITKYKSISENEVSKILNISQEEVVNIIGNLVTKGLLREIPGEISTYQALPPYSALLSQTSQLKSIISEIQENIPKILDEKLKILEKPPNEIKKLEPLQTDLQNVANDLYQIINKELKSLELGLEKVKKLHEFDRFVKDLKSHVLKELNTEFNRFKEIFENVKSKMSSVFEKQLRINSLKVFVEKIVTNIVAGEFDHVQEFERRFATKIDETINATLSKFSNMPETPGKVSFSVKDTSENILKNLEDPLKNIESKFLEVQSEITNSNNELIQKLKEEINETIRSEIFDKIYNQIEQSEKIMQGFWDHIKRSSSPNIKNNEQ